MAKIFPVSMMDDYREAGYLRFPDVFPAYEMNSIRTAAYATASIRTGSVQWLPNGKPALLFWPQKHSFNLNRYAHDPRLADIVTFFLGDKVRQINNQVYFRESSDGDQFAWHQDVLFRTPPEDFDNIEDNYLQTIIVVDPVTPENGAIEFIPGSHKHGDRKLLKSGTDPALRSFVRGDWYGKKIAANPGDVIVWHPLTIHGSEPNCSGKPRMTYMNGFAADSAVLNKGKYPTYAAV